MEREYRIERDSMGEMRVPADSYWGAQTQRAVENFPVSGIRLPPLFISVIGLVKMAAAAANGSLGLLDEDLADAIERAARDVSEGRLDDQFVVDIFQTGSGTSTNMNANEVIANRANETLGHPLGSRKPVHPNDHVNMGQSSNDVIPTCLHVAAFRGARENLLPALDALQESLSRKERDFDRIVKIGRTHMQDATPIRLGQEFSGYRSMIAHAIERIERSLDGLRELAIGGTAVGTGLNTHRDFPRLVIEKINEELGCDFVEAENHFEAQGARDGVVEASGALKTLAVGLMKIGNDIRFLSCGPRCGIGELVLPAVQPGSSIMPGKINPVIAESLCQVAAQVIGNDSAVTVGGMLGHLELNVMMPVMAHNLLQSIEILGRGVRNFTNRCIDGLKADENRIDEMIDKSLALCTALSPVVGYDEAASIAKEAHSTGRTVREIALERQVLPEEKLDEVLDPLGMTERK
jgi:fumarate hydratase class II